MDISPLQDVRIRSAEPAATDWVARARALRPLIEAAGARTEAARELAPEVVQALHAAGLFRMLIPRDLGGAQLDLPTYLRVVEALAEADANVAWCVGQGTGCSFTAAYLPPTAARTMFGDDPRAVLAWGPGPNGQAVPVSGGWCITGRWGFASGSRHANWLGGMCPILDETGARRLDADGTPAIRTFVFPKQQANVIDDWHVVGLRGTGSDSYSVTDLFVPEAFCYLRTAPPPRPGPLYKLALLHIYPPSFGAVALGIARATLDDFVVMARGKTPRGSQPMRENAAIQSMLGHAEVRLRAARMFLFQSVADIWRDLEEGAAVSDAHELTLRMASTYAIQEAAAVVDVAYHEAGATAILQSKPFERRFRDVHAVAQQIQGRRANFELAGQRLLGVPTGPLFQ
jgi:alkylation response protein AidB-like acyl-CoA dehydrogenase